MSLIIMSCITDVENISIYGRRGQRGRPTGSIYTDEQKEILEMHPKHIIPIIMNTAPYNNYAKRMLDKQQIS